VHGHTTFKFTIQPDGKILLPAEFMTTNTMGGAKTDGVIFRFSADGVLDPTFGVAGVATYAPTIEKDSLTAVGVQSDGKILAVGHSRPAGITRMVVVRYLANGTLDTTFGTSGVLFPDFLTGENTYGRDIEVLSDDTFTVIGFALKADTTSPLLMARYSASGELDATFGTNGMVTLNTEIEGRVCTGAGLGLVARENLGATFISSQRILYIGGSSCSDADLDNRFLIGAVWL